MFIDTIVFESQASGSRIWLLLVLFSVRRVLSIIK